MSHGRGDDRGDPWNACVLEVVSFQLVSQSFEFTKVPAVKQATKIIAGGLAGVKELEACSSIQRLVLIARFVSERFKMGEYGEIVNRIARGGLDLL